jgi:hypothetical protein
MHSEQSAEFIDGTLDDIKPTYITREELYRLILPPNSQTYHSNPSDSVPMAVTSLM